MDVADNLKLWFDKDFKPYKKGENPEYDKILDELTKSMVERVLNGEFDAKDSTDTSER